ncbi:MAG: MaoC/PaaZ C-terminal domain-containing protein [Halobacteriota archaeon]|nr:MaoC/PaaZ C-terminal domain-containing protein [Halobacteriota archaeon]
MEVGNFDAINVGDEISLEKGPTTRDQLKKYAKASGDVNPIHTTPAVAEKAGLGDVISHGLFNMAHVNHMLADWAGPDGMVKMIDVQMRSMGRPDDMLISKGKITKKYEEDGKKIVDLDVWQESKTLVTPEKEEKGYFKEGDEYITEGDDKFRIQKTVIVGTASVILP